MNIDHVLAEKVMGLRYRHCSVGGPDYWEGENSDGDLVFQYYADSVPTSAPEWECAWHPSEDPAQLDDCFRNVTCIQFMQAFDMWRATVKPTWKTAQECVRAWQLSSTKEKADALAKAVQDKENPNA